MQDKENKNNFIIPNHFKNAYITLVFSLNVLLGIIEIWGFIAGGDYLTKAIVGILIMLLSSVAALIYLYRQYIQEKQVRLLIIFSIPMFIGFLLTSSYYIYSYNQVEARFVAPELRRFGKLLPNVGVYGTNAGVEENQIYKTYNSPDTTHFLRLRFVMFCGQDDMDCNGGWILTNLGGYNVKDSKYLVFLVRGHDGGEEFGVGIKDTFSTEVKIFNVSDYLPDEKVETGWQKVSIPLDDFRTRNINLTSLENLSFFVDAMHTDQRQIQFDIANIQFR